MPKLNLSKLKVLVPRVETFVSKGGLFSMVLVIVGALGILQGKDMSSHFSNDEIVTFGLGFFFARDTAQKIIEALHATKV